MNDLDKRIAEHIMGEKESDLPDPYSDNFSEELERLHPFPRYWHQTMSSMEWRPYPFSSDWNWCMKAIKAAKFDMVMTLDSEIEDTGFLAYEAFFEVGDNNSLADLKAEAQTMEDFPRVICELLLEAEEVYQKEIKPKQENQ